jgi:hypothetical protein
VSKVFVKSLLFAMLAMVVLSGCGATTVPASTLAPAYPNSGSAYPNPAYPNPATSGSVSFAKDVLPILVDNCFKCHGGDKTEKGLILNSYASVMTGSQNGAVIVAGNADNSLLFKNVSSGKMPKRGTKLTPQQLDLIRNWINSGEPDN